MFQASTQLGALNMKKLVVRFAKDENGATAIEYGLIAAGIALAITAAVPVIGTRLSGTFTSLQTAVK
jgi:pilus assembly protein Flp/PilA